MSIRSTGCYARRGSRLLPRFLPTANNSSSASIRKRSPPAQTGIAPLLRHASPASVRRTGVAPGIVKRAEDYIHAHGNDIASVGDLTAAVGVSATTLRDAFQHFRGISPMQYVRQSRLDRARETLVQALQPSDVRIADLALNCGFTHLGRFAQAYRERFVESPSQTPKARR